MPEAAYVESLFRTLQSETIQAFEEELKRKQEEQKQLTKYRQRLKERMQERLQALQVTPERLAYFIEDDEKAMQEFVREIRPPLVERLSHRGEDAKKLAIASGLAIPGRRVVPLYAATLLATDVSSLEGNPGEQGNPWVFPSNPGQVKIKVSQSGEGWGCDWGGPHYPHSAQVVFWYTFTPDVTDVWVLLPQVNLYGFYIMFSDDNIFTCKQSAVDIYVSVSAFQYFWYPDKWHVQLQRAEDNVNLNSLITSNLLYQLESDVELRAGDPVIVKVGVTISCEAQGGGSYSELNFSDGTGNYIDTTVLLAMPFHGYP